VSNMASQLSDLTSLSSSSALKEQLEEKKTEADEARAEVHIVVQEAKIDPARYVQSLTSSSSSSSKKKIAKNGAVGSRLQDRRRPRSGAEAVMNVTPQEESTQFELRIAFSGRTYTAVRSLPSILRLRQDLVSELECQQQQQNSSGRGPGGACIIPEVPRRQDDAASSSYGSVCADGVVGRGFSFLQAVIRSYTPALEGWLRQVTSLVPPKDSPSLMQFLWEPLVRRTASASSTPTDQQLDSIEESEHDCDED